MRYTFDDPDAPTTKRAQYYEMFGHRAIVADGWKAVTRHQAGTPFDDDRWELYHYDVDRSECHDLAGAMPEKRDELVALWWEEAEDQGVLPLDDRSIELFFTRYRDNSVHPTDRRYTYYPPMAPLPAQVAPGMGGKGFDLAATVDRPAGAGGVLFATGTENSGLSVFVQGDRLVFDYNCFNDHLVVESTVAVPTGPSVVGVRFRRGGAGATATLFIDGAACGDLTIPFAMHIISSVGPSVGYDHGSPVSERYTGHFPFEGTLHKVDIAIVHKGGESPDVLAAHERAAMAQQ
jgi:arylsulfatase